MAILQTDASGLALTDNNGKPLVYTSGSVLQTKSTTAHAASATTNIGGFARDTTDNWQQFITCDLTVKKATSSILFLATAFATARKTAGGANQTYNLRTKVMRNRAGVWTDVASVNSGSNYTGNARWNPKSSLITGNNNDKAEESYGQGGVLTWMIMDPIGASADNQTVTYAIWFTNSAEGWVAYLGSGAIESPPNMSAMTLIEFSGTTDVESGWNENSTYP